MNGVPLACVKCFLFLLMIASSSFSLVSMILVLSMVVVFPVVGSTCWVIGPTLTWVRGLLSLGLIVLLLFRQFLLALWRLLYIFIALDFSFFVRFVCRDTVAINLSRNSSQYFLLPS